jgi:3-oxoadipate enol-lactonase
VDHVTDRPAVIVGHSGGGGIALGLALSDPGRIAALVLVSPGVPGYPWPHDDPYFGAWVKLFAAGDREGLVRLGLATWAPAGDDAAVTAEINAAVTAFLTVGELEQPDPPAYDHLGEVRAPAVMVRGDREYPMVADCADAIASCIPDCRRVVIPGADHMLPLRAPHQLAAIIAGLAADLDGHTRTGSNE